MKDRSWRGTLALMSIALILFLVAGFWANPTGIAVGSVGFLWGVTRVGRIPTKLAGLFSFWIGVVLLALLRFEESTLVATFSGILGASPSMILMLVGIWLVPIFLLPLGFALRFDQWKDQ
jgi:hypothetical protein